MIKMGEVEEDEVVLLPEYEEFHQEEVVEDDGSEMFAPVELTVSIRHPTFDDHGEQSRI